MVNINCLLHEGYLSLEYVDDEESNFAIELKSFDKGIKAVERKFFFLNNLRLLFRVREKVLHRFKSRLFPLKNFDEISTGELAPEWAPEPIKRKKYK